MERYRPPPGRGRAVTAYLLTFGVALLAALASRSPLSTSAAFLAAGVVAGRRCSRSPSGSLGVGVPLAIRTPLRTPGVGVVDTLHPLGPLGVAVLLYGLCDLLDANQFLAAFLTGATPAGLASCSRWV